MSSGLSGLLAFQRALDTTSHNIANASTEGYVRQRVELGTRPASPFANGWIGNGVDVQTVRRTVDDFLVSQYPHLGSTLERSDIFASQAERVSKLFVDGDSGLSGSLQKLQNAIQGVATEPTSMAARQVLLGEAQGCRANGSATLTASCATSTRRAAPQIGVADGRDQRARQRHRPAQQGNRPPASARTGQPPNDLLDERDRLIDQLSGKIAVTYVPQDDGILNVFVGRGQALVLEREREHAGCHAGSLRRRPRPHLADEHPGHGRHHCRRSRAASSAACSTSGRRCSTRPAMTSGDSPAGLAEAMNEQHRAGVDLKGALGTDLFAVGAPVSVARSTNTGNAQVAVSRSSASASDRQ
jgi:flagellar hook-associated protein 1